jgi:hypothetical protein
VHLLEAEGGTIQEKFGGILGGFLTYQDAEMFGDQLINHWGAGGAAPASRLGLNQ